MLNIGWFSTGRGEGSRGLLNFVQTRLGETGANARINFVFSNRGRGEAEGSDEFFGLVDSYGIPLITHSSTEFRKQTGGRFSDRFARRADLPDRAGGIVGTKAVAMHDPSQVEQSRRRTRTPITRDEVIGLAPHRRHQGTAAEEAHQKELQQRGCEPRDAIALPRCGRGRHRIKRWSDFRHRTVRRRSSCTRTRPPSSSL